MPERYKIDGFICPGHVSIVIGAGAYAEAAEKYAIPCVITGFEPLDILQGVGLLIDQVETGRAEVENQYRRAVTWEGNVAARKLWRRFSNPWIPPGEAWESFRKAGLFCPAWKKFDWAAPFALPDIKVLEHPGCKCGEVLRGIILPPECGLIRKACSPREPKGPCMVSSEGTCGAYYRYHRR